MLSGVYRCQRRDGRLLKWSFKARVKCSLKCYSCLGVAAKFLVLLLVEFCLDGSFRQTNLDVNWSIDSLRVR